MSGADRALLTTIARRFDQHPGRLGKQPLRHVTDVFGATDWATGPGDDAAVVARPDGHLLAAGEAIYPPFVSVDPFGAGVGAVVANVNDIAAMGGRPLAIVDTVVAPEDQARAVLAGLAHAADLYGVPIVGGHLTVTEGPPSVSAFVVGEVEVPLTATNVSAGQTLLLAACLDGHLRDDFGFYPSFERRGTAVRGDIAVLRRVAEHGVAVAAKDVSMAGMLGTLGMLLQPSGCGATVDVDLVPRPDDVPIETWLEVFPSYAFLLCTAVERVADCVAAFTDRGLACAPIGKIDATAALRLRVGSQEITLLEDVVASATGLGTPPQGQ